MSLEYKEEWSRAQLWVFRAVFSFFMLFILLMFLSGFLEIPFRWIGDHILGITYDYDISGYGSGDNTYAYVTLFVNITIAAIATVIWAVLDSKRKHYHKLQYWFIVILRVFLFLTMVLYGFVKVYQIQFQPPSLTRLLEPLGNFSPMGLAWTYMGFSKAFGMFAGILEVSAGCLIIFRRTQTLGALLVIGVMTQVAMMNFSFDIPVKIFSITLILMAMVIVAGDLNRMIAFFFKNQPTQPFQPYHPNSSEKYHRLIPKVKTVLLIIILLASGVLGYIGQLNINGPNKKSELYGIWELTDPLQVSDTISNGNIHLKEWKYLIFELRSVSVIKTTTDKKFRFNVELDSSRNTLKLTSNNENDSLIFSYYHVEKQLLELQFKEDSLLPKIKMTYKDPESFTLTSRGFHWINESPYNQ